MAPTTITDEEIRSTWITPADSDTAPTADDDGTDSAPTVPADDDGTDSGGDDDSTDSGADDDATDS